MSSHISGGIESTIAGNTATTTPGIQQKPSGKEKTKLLRQKSQSSSDIKGLCWDKMPAGKQQLLRGVSSSPILSTFTSSDINDLLNSKRLSLSLDFDFPQETTFIVDNLDQCSSLSSRTSSPRLGLFKSPRNCRKCLVPRRASSDALAAEIEAASVECLYSGLGASLEWSSLDISRPDPDQEPTDQDSSSVPKYINQNNETGSKEPGEQTASEKHTTPVNENARESESDNPLLQLGTVTAFTRRRNSVIKCKKWLASLPSDIEANTGKEDF